MQFGELVLGQCFGRKQVKSAGIRILEHRIQYRQVVAEGFARRRRGNHNDVFPIVNQLGCERLV